MWYVQLIYFKTASFFTDKSENRLGYSYYLLFENLFRSISKKCTQIQALYIFFLFLEVIMINFLAYFAISLP